MTSTTSPQPADAHHTQLEEVLDVIADRVDGHYLPPDREFIASRDAGSGFVTIEAFHHDRTPDEDFVVTVTRVEPAKTTPEEVPAVHQVVPTITPGGALELTFTCTAPEGAPCRVICTSCDADNHPAPGHVHDLLHVPSCWVIETYNEADSLEVLTYYAGGSAQLTAGPVDLAEDAYSPEWKYTA